MEAKRIGKNAWHGAKLLVDMNDKVPALNEQVRAYLLEYREELISFKREYVLQYHAVLFNC